MADKEEDKVEDREVRDAPDPPDTLMGPLPDPAGPIGSSGSQLGFVQTGTTALGETLRTQDPETTEISCQKL